MWGEEIMNKNFQKELEYLDEIEELIENTNLLQDGEVKKHYDSLLELKEELLNSEKETTVVLESILEDIAVITQCMTRLIESKMLGKMTAKLSNSKVQKRCS